MAENEMIILKEVPLVAVVILIALGFLLGAIIMAVTEYDKEKIIIIGCYVVAFICVMALAQVLPEWMVGMIAVGVITLIWLIHKVS